MRPPSKGNGIRKRRYSTSGGRVWLLVPDQNHPGAPRTRQRKAAVSSRPRGVLESARSSVPRRDAEAPGVASKQAALPCGHRACLLPPVALSRFPRRPMSEPSSPPPRIAQEPRTRGCLTAETPGKTSARRHARPRSGPRIDPGPLEMREDARDPRVPGHEALRSASRRRSAQVRLEAFLVLVHALERCKVIRQWAIEGWGLEVARHARGDRAVRSRRG
jgi:hypothetical protein